MYALDTNLLIFAHDSFEVSSLRLHLMATKINVTIGLEDGELDKMYREIAVSVRVSAKVTT